MKKLFAILLSLFAIGGVSPVFASHIVGGEVTYTCQGGDNYLVSVTIYEDCLNGDPQAIAEDDPAYIGVFDGGSGANVRFDSVFSSSTITVPTNFVNSCITNPPPTCLRKKTFQIMYNLPPRANGYYIVYQRCCRNATILNIYNPSQVGATYFCRIPPASLASCNNSAVFKNYPPQIICINNPLVYDHSAYDPDGDSLSYEFCQSYTGGSESDAKPTPGPPPFDTVVWRSPFTYSDPMAGSPPIEIDPVTGLITGTPNLLGRYVVAVCCHEWRGGHLINTVTREFQFVVADCSKAVVADMPQYSTDFNTYIINCKNYTIHFQNTSKGGFAYKWDFGVDGATSTEFEPTFTYPDTGTYLVKLVVNPGSTCPDSITRFVKLYPVFSTNYTDSGLQCPNMPIKFTDLSSATFNPINTWMWSFGDGDTSEQQNPVHTFNTGGTYNVELISQNVKHCSDTMIKQLLVEKFTPFAGDDTIIVKGQSIYFDATGGSSYLWMPGTDLNDSAVYDPVGYYPDTGHFAYAVQITTPFGCIGYDTVHVQVVGQPSYFVPTAFTPNGDGHNDVFRVIAVGFSNLHFKVFNRWGQIVYEGNSFRQGWDGTYNHKYADMGTYFWELSMTDRYNTIVKAKGDVVLLR